ENLVALAERLAVPLYRIEEVVSFFPHYRKTPPPQLEVHVCRDMSCHLRGSASLISDLEANLASEITAGRASVCGVSCLGRCDRAPAVRIHSHAAGKHDGSHEPLSYLGRRNDEVVAVAKALASGKEPVVQPDQDADLPDRSPAWKINAYAGKPREERYQAVKRVIEAIRRGPAMGDAERDRIIQSALKNAVLLGMGGAGGQAFKKWCEVREAVGQRKYVVCNADESDCCGRPIWWSKVCCWRELFSARRRDTSISATNMKNASQRSARRLRGPKPSASLARTSSAAASI
ncbi:MAG: NAD(P)H-dependent oxidoreductase subunit E, partial [Planctomycetia bacterium]|nr:NAD(P)H-dependent oxidoreductase subunit E [Planctomycetia bacterium]